MPKQYNPIANLRNEVWNRKIDHMSTKEVALFYGLSRPTVLRILRKIVSDRPGDGRFVYNPERKGVIISDGSLFTYEERAINGDSVGGKGPKHYIWFCS